MFTGYYLLALLLPSLVQCGLTRFERDETACPTLTLFNNDSSDCVCGNFNNGIVHCDSNTKCVKVLDCYCVTFDKDTNQTYVGFSPYACNTHHHVLYDVPSSPKQLDSAICGLHNRTGQMCGSCQEGFAPPVYSYSFACVECSDYKYNWLKYIAVAYLPLTLFYFIVVFFRINISSPSLSVYVQICLLVGTNWVLTMISEYNSYKTNTVLVIYTGFSLWNMDFFRVLYTPFCLHPKMTTLQALSLDYLISIYPLSLIILTYVLVKLHDKYSLVVWLWTPFRRCFSYFRKEWKLSNSLVSAFCTFMLLSYVKILYISFRLLAPVQLYDASGTALKQKFFLYNGTIEWFSEQHWPYALLAIVMCLIFNILPLFLLLLYPCACFQRCLNCLKISSFALKVFMDVFQGHYKTNSRYIAASYLAVHIANATILMLGQVKEMYIATLGTLLIFFGIIVAILQPYKKKEYNILSLLLILLLAHFAGTYGLLLFAHESDISAEYGLTVYNLLIGILFIGLSIPPLYGIGYLIYNMLPRCFLDKMKHLFRQLKCKKDRNVESEETPVNPFQLSSYYQINESTPLIHNIV